MKTQGCLANVVHCLTLSLLVPLCLLAQQLPIVNDTSSMKVQVTSSNGELHLTVRNASTQYVRAFSVTCGKLSINQEFVPPKNFGIGPGAIYEMSLSSPESQGSECSSYTFGAVLYANGDAEGDPDQVAALKQLRAGRLLQAKRIQAILQTIPDTLTDSQEESAALEKVRGELSNLSLSPKENVKVRGFVANGMQAARTEATTELDQIIDRLRNTTPSNSTLSEAKALVTKFKQDHQTMLSEFQKEGVSGPPLN